MLKNKTAFVILTAAAALSASSMVSAQEVLRLTPDQVWQPATEYELAVRDAKKLVETGKCGQARKAFDQLASYFTEPKDVNAFKTFVDAELDRCRGKYTKAAIKHGKSLSDPDYSQTPFYEASLQSQFHIGQEFLAGRKKKVLGFIPMSGHPEGVSIMDAIALREGLDEANGIGVRAAKAVARSYHQKGRTDAANYEFAYFKWLYLYEESRVGQQLNEEALLGMAQAKHAMYRGPRYDASCLANQEGTGAKDYYERFKSDYNRDANEVGAEKLIKEIDAELAYKNLTIGQYYEKTRDKRQKAQGHNPAILYYDMVIANWYEKFRLQYPQDAERIDYREILKHVDTQLSDPPSVDSLYQETGNGNVARFLMNHWPEAKVAKEALQLLTGNSSTEEIKK